MDGFGATSDRFGVDLDGLLIVFLKCVIEVLIDLLLFWNIFLGTMFANLFFESTN